MFSDKSKLSDYDFGPQRDLGTHDGGRRSPGDEVGQPKKQVFVIQFAVGEFDMVVFDPATSSCEIYEIKHSTEIVPEQIRHLIDEEKCRMTEHRFGTITGKNVIYRGSAEMADEVQYLNVEKYLCRLK